jgi:PIN domain nuclease of toxin-antitoxin system
LNLLLDTHALLWALADPKKMPSRAREEIANPKNQVYVSAISVWELVIKSALRRVDLPFAGLDHTLEAAGFAELPVTIAHTLGLRGLPWHHRDPFDRLLVAQAREAALTLVTRDPVFRSYPVRILWT